MPKALKTHVHQESRILNSGGHTILNEPVSEDKNKEVHDI